MEWIKVKDQLPKYDEFVLFCLETEYLDGETIKTFYLGWLNSKDEIKAKKDEWFADGVGEWYPFNKVTHWMPLPEPPK